MPLLGKGAVASRGHRRDAAEYCGEQDGPATAMVQPQVPAALRLKVPALTLSTSAEPWCVLPSALAGSVRTP